MFNSIIVSLIIISTAVLIALRQYYKSKERRAMIEKGLDPSLVNIYSKGIGRKIFLFAGILSLGLALGIVTGIILATLFKTPGETKELILLSVLVFVGLSFFVCYYLWKDKMS